MGKAQKRVSLSLRFKGVYFFDTAGVLFQSSGTLDSSGVLYHTLQYHYHSI